MKSYTQLLVLADWIDKFAIVLTKKGNKNI